MSSNHSDVISREYPGGNIPGRPWTSREIAELRRLAPLGAEVVAEVLERSVKSVIQQAHRLRISLRRQGERRGRILGQPRRSSYLADEQLAALRTDVVEGRFDVGIVLERARSTELCPACGINPIEVDATGFCVPCHNRHLARRHAEAVESRRELDRERQRKHRRKARKEEA